MQEVKTEILRLWEEKQLRITDEIQTAPEVLYANGSVIGTLGNFSASTGKAKSKKTFNVAAIVRNDSGLVWDARVCFGR